MTTQSRSSKCRRSSRGQTWRKQPPKRNNEGVLHGNSAITLAVKDIVRAKEFYTQGLGCQLLQEEGEFVSLGLGEGSSTLALYGWDALAEDAGIAADSDGFRAFTLSYIVERG